MTGALPRLVIAGLAGDSGKTAVSLALALASGDRGIPTAGFKKGPDYIDTAWLAWATGRTARNLDAHLMGAAVARASFATHALHEGVNVIEGNRGVYDGSDARGGHSTAELAKLLLAPVVLVIDASKVTRTAAALVLGCQVFDRDVEFAGVILNRVGGSRHERVLREAIDSACHLPVLGAIPRRDSSRLLPARHLGLVMPAEYTGAEDLRRELREVAKGLDIDRLLAIARDVPALDVSNPAEAGSHATDVSNPAEAGSHERAPAEAGSHDNDVGSGFSRICIGYLADSAFSFYYPENLEALEREGAALVPISALDAPALPEDIDALYIGGGFPETHAAKLSSNVGFLRSLKGACESGLPVYAECGGLMLLSSAIRWNQQRYPMAGVLPFDVDMHERPQAHGYSRLVVDGDNPFFPPGTVLDGHEFHYSRIVGEPGHLSTACAVTRGTGCLPGRDGLVFNRTFASYTHLHALATPQWAIGLVSAAKRRAESR